MVRWGDSRRPCPPYSPVKAPARPKILESSPQAFSTPGRLDSPRRGHPAQAIGKGSSPRRARRRSKQTQTMGNKIVSTQHSARRPLRGLGVWVEPKLTGSDKQGRMGCWDSFTFEFKINSKHLSNVNLLHGVPDALHSLSLVLKSRGFRPQTRPTRSVYNHGYVIYICFLEIDTYVRPKFFFVYLTFKFNITISHW